MAEKNFLFSFLWLLLLLFIGWPIAGICAGWWVFILPFEGIHDVVKQITGFLEKVMTWPRDIGKAILGGETTFPKPS